MARILFIFAVMALTIMPMRANAQSIAVVDVDRLLSESKAGKSIQAQHTSKRAAYQKEFTALENKLAAAEKQLVKDKESVSPEEFMKKRQAFEKEFQETRRLFQKRRNSLDKGLADSFKTLRKIIIQTTAEISETGNYDIVVTRESVVIVDKKMDITDAVLKKMNAKVSNVPLTVQ